MFYVVPPIQWIPMGNGSVPLPPGDDASTEIITPVGFVFGGSWHHEIYVSLALIQCISSFVSKVRMVINDTKKNISHIKHQSITIG